MSSEVSEKRRLEVGVAGRWYLGLTIALGVVAVASANNVLYLLLSFLLGALVLSGILSEAILKDLEIVWIREPTFAGEPSRDRIEIWNHSALPAVGLQWGTWSRKAGFGALAQALWVAPRSRAQTSAHRVYLERGRVTSSAEACATGAPFGLAMKVRVLEIESSRIIWPRRLGAGESRGLPRGARMRSRLGRGGHEWMEGELREWDPSEDARLVVWSASAQRGQWLARKTNPLQPVPDLELDLDVLRDPKQRELAISWAATVLSQGLAQGARLREHGRVHTYETVPAALDALALIPALTEQHAEVTTS